MTTPSVRRRTSTAPVASSRPPIRDLTGRGAYSVEWDVRTIYDFVFSLSDDAGSTEDLPSHDRDWLRTERAALREEVGEAIDLYASELCVVLVGLTIDRPDVTDAAAFVRALDDTDPRDVVRAVILDHRDPERQALLERAMNGDDEAVQRLVALELDHGSHMNPEAVALLYRDPVRGVEPARAVLRAWLPRFEPIEDRIRGMIQRDFDARAGDRASLPPIDLVERTTGGIRWLAEPGVRRVVLAPSYFARPYNYLMAGSGWQLFGYPIADTALDEADPLAPPAALVRLHRALGDETRMRILKLLASRDWYLSEIAQQLELSKPTIKHHLALLRAAGLVTLTEEGSLSWYSLRRDPLREASTELGRFLLD